jgi:TetR/AcrR family transcriptional regulator, transcriptional repressor for nem operon
MYDDRVRRQTLADLEAQLPPRNAIRALFLAFLPAGKSKGPGRGCFLTNTALERAAHDPEAARVVAHAQEQIEGFFARMIRKGQALGHIHQDRDADTIARGLLAALIGLIVLTRSRPDPILLESVIADAMARLE